MFTKFFTLAVLIFSGCCCSSLQGAAHQDWRLLITACNGCSGGGAETSLFDLEIYDAAGTYLPVGGTPTVDLASNGTTAANLFDRNPSTIWEAFGLPTTIAPHWAAYHFLTAVSVSTVRLVTCACITSRRPGFPNSFKFQYSDDAGVTWFDATGNLIPQYWDDGNGGFNPSWSFTVDPPMGGYFANWRINATAASSGGFQITLAEIGFKNTIGGGVVTTTNASYPFGTGNGSCCTLVANYFDTNATTFGTSTIPALNGYAFEMPYKILEVDLTNQVSGGSPTWVSNSPTAFTVQGSNDVGMNWTTAFTCTAAWTGPGQIKACGVTLDQRGNIAYNQIREADREGAAHQFQMFGGGQTVPGHAAAYDGSGNVVDAGVVALGRITAPVTHTDPCTVGQIAIDGSGNWYWCYGTNLWARIGPGGYSNSF